MTKKLLISCWFLYMVACRQKATPPSGEQIRVEIELENVTTQMINHAWVDAGRGELDFGNIAAGRGLGATYGDYPATLNAPLNVRWQFEKGVTIQSATNVLGRGVSAGDRIKVILDESSAKASTN